MIAALQGMLASNADNTANAEATAEHSGDGFILLLEAMLAANQAQLSQAPITPEQENAGVSSGLHTKMEQEALLDLRVLPGAQNRQETLPEPVFVKQAAEAERTIMLTEVKTEQCRNLTKEPEQPQAHLQMKEAGLPVPPKENIAELSMKGEETAAPAKYSPPREAAEEPAKTVVIAAASGKEGTEKVPRTIERAAQLIAKKEAEPFQGEKTKAASTTELSGGFFDGAGPKNIKQVSLQDNKASPPKLSQETVKKESAVKHLPVKMFGSEASNTFVVQELPEQEAGGQKLVRLPAQDMAEEFPRLVRERLGQPAPKEGNREFLVQLEPKELGKLLVKLTSREGVVSVKIFVEQADTKLLLDNNMPQLRQSFFEQGIRYGRMEVEVRNEFSGFNGQQQEPSHQKQEPPTFAWRRAAYDEPLLQAAPELLAATSMVDYFA